jgi:hypothetical protein
MAVGLSVGRSLGGRRGAWTLGSFVGVLRAGLRQLEGVVRVEKLVSCTGREAGISFWKTE